MNFIKTTDAETAKKLRDSGFTEIKETGPSCFVFINDRNISFSDDDILKLKYTLSNKLFV